MAWLEQVISDAVANHGAAIMGVLNVTPDSFSDGGRFLAPESAERQVKVLLEEGADILDIGAESSRPGAVSVPAELQIERLGPALRRATELGALVSVDTTDPSVGAWALGQGARFINDVSCLENQDLARAIADHDAYLVLMHTRGPLGSMHGFSTYPESGYEDIVRDVLAEWSASRDRAEQAGLARSHILFDPGLGFAKSARHSLEIVRRLREFEAALAPVVVGPSRKSFVSAVDPAPPEARLGGTIATCLLAAARGASVLRVHDVRPVRQALMVFRAALAPGEELWNV